MRYYRCLALFKLAAIVEAAWSQYLAGELRTDYAAALGRDVPALLAEACANRRPPGLVGGSDNARPDHPWAPGSRLVRLGGKEDPQRREETT